MAADLLDLRNRIEEDPGRHRRVNLMEEEVVGFKEEEIDHDGHYYLDVLDLQELTAEARHTKCEISQHLFTIEELTSKLVAISTRIAKHKEK